MFGFFLLNVTKGKGEKDLAAERLECLEEIQTRPGKSKNGSREIERK